MTVTVLSLEPNNTFNTASNLGDLSGQINFRRNDFVGNSDLNDYYRFSLTAASSLTITLTPFSADADLELYNSAGQRLESSLAGGTNVDAISDLALAAGVYYIRVFPGVPGASTNYNLRVQSNGVQVDPGNVLALARDLGTFDDLEYSFSELVGTADAVDLYRLAINEPRTLNLRLSGLESNADLALLSSTGQVIVPSNNLGTTDEVISQSLSAGIYYVRVAAVTGTTSYNLTILDTPPDLGGNTLPQATPITVGITPTIIDDAVGVFDFNDYYSFTLTTSTPNTLIDLNLALTQLNANADLELLNSSGQRIELANRSGFNDEAINRLLAAGTYYVRVFSPTGNNTSYRLLLSTAYPSNLLPTEVEIGLLGSTPVVFAQRPMSPANTADVYRFSIPSNTTNLTNFNATLTGLTVDADIRLIRDFNGNGIVDSSDEVVAVSNRSGLVDDSINLSALPVGTYFVQVFQFQGNGSYTLRLSTSDPSNLLATDTTVGTLTTPRTFNGAVSNSDTSDIYSFSFSQPGSFFANLSGLTANTRMRLIQDTNNNGIVDSADGVLVSTPVTSSSEGILFNNLAAGNYFLQVYQVSGSTNYTLVLNPDTAGNTPANAFVIANLGATPIFTNEFVGVADADDFYRFTLTTRSNFNLALTNLTADIDVQLLDSSGTVVGNVINRSERGGTNDETINQILNPGTYYVRVYSFGNNSSYRLWLSALAFNGSLTPPSNLLPVEFDLGVLSNTPITVGGSVSSADTSDVYRFNLATTGSFNLSLTGLSPLTPNDADVRLIRDVNDNGIFDSTDLFEQSILGVGLDESINISSLAAGTYFVQVYQVSGNTPYTLTLRR